MAGKLTRRAFLGRAGSLLALAAISVACGGKKKVTSTSATGSTLAVFLLSTADAKCTGARCACGACQKHAANKLFSSRETADANRAHAHCNCTVVEDRLPAERWRALFGDPAKPDRDHVDRRDSSVAKAFA